MQPACFGTRRDEWRAWRPSSATSSFDASRAKFLLHKYRCDGETLYNEAVSPSIPKQHLEQVAAPDPLANTVGEGMYGHNYNYGTMNDAYSWAEWACFVNATSAPVSTHDTSTSKTQQVINNIVALQGLIVADVERVLGRARFPKEVVQVFDAKPASYC